MSHAARVLLASALLSACADEDGEVRGRLDASLDARARADVLDRSKTVPSRAYDAGAIADGFVPAHVDALYADDTLAHWATYVDQLALASVLDEVVIPPSPEVEARGEGYVGRQVTLRIEGTIWLRKGAAEQTGELPLLVFGWVLQNGVRVETGPAHAPRILPGGRYLLPLVKYDGGLGLLTAGSVLAAPGDPIATQDIALRGQGDVARGLSTKTLDEIAASLAMTRALR